MVKLKVKLSPKGQIVIPKPIRDKLGIESGKILLIDEKDGKIVIEKCDVEGFIEWIKKTRKKDCKRCLRIQLGE